MALPRLFPGSIPPREGCEWNSEVHPGESKEFFNRGPGENASFHTDHTRKSAWIAGRGFGRLRVLMEDAFYGWMIWD
jgi:hypothetical protein